MPNRYLAPGLLLLRLPEGASFIPVSTDVRAHLAYNAGKMFAKLTSEKNISSKRYMNSDGATTKRFAKILQIVKPNKKRKMLGLNF